MITTIPQRSMNELNLFWKGRVVTCLDRIYFDFFVIFLESHQNCQLLFTSSFRYFFVEKTLNYEYMTIDFKRHVFLTMSMKTGCHTHGIFWTVSFDTLAKSLLGV